MQIFVVFLLTKVSLTFFLSLISVCPLHAKGNSTNFDKHSSHPLHSLYSAKKSEIKQSVSDIRRSFATVTASALNVRSGPSSNSSVLQVILQGRHLLPLSPIQNKWLKVQIPKGIKGWIAQRYVKIYVPKTLPIFKNKPASMPFTSLLEASIKSYMEQMYFQKKVKPVDKLFIVVEDLTTEVYEVSIRHRHSVKSASTIKVPILHAFMIQRSRGNIKEPLKYEQQLEEMIRYSSNPSTNTIIKLLGGPKKIQKLLNGTKFYNELELAEAIPDDGRTYQNKISAADLNKIFVNIWFNRVIDSEYNLVDNRATSKEMLRLLELPGHSWLKDSIKAGTCFSSNKSVKIWDKTGFVKGVKGNGGIVEIDSPHGRKAYSIVMFIERENYQTIIGDATQWSENMGMHMRKISEMTYAFFSNRYESYNKCGLSLLNRYANIALESYLLQASL